MSCKTYPERDSLLTVNEQIAASWAMYEAVDKMVRICFFGELGEPLSRLYRMESTNNMICTAEGLPKSRRRRRPTINPP